MPQSSKHRSLRPLLLGVALASGLAASTGVAAQTAPAAPAPVATNGTLLSISAEAEAKRTPDIARLSTGVVTRAADAKAAMAANAEQMSRVLAAIKDAGIAEADIQTSGVNLNPQYRYQDDQPPAITGYEARNTVDITVRDIGALGELMDALVAVGANQINGPGFDVADDEKAAAYDEARRAAIEKARARARMYAETLDMQVRRIVSISEGQGFMPPRPVPMMAMARMEKAADTPIEPGQSTLSVTLDVVFELGK